MEEMRYTCNCQICIFNRYLTSPLKHITPSHPEPVPNWKLHRTPKPPLCLLSQWQELLSSKFLKPEVWETCSFSLTFRLSFSWVLIKLNSKILKSPTFQLFNDPTLSQDVIIFSGPPGSLLNVLSAPILVLSLSLIQSPYSSRDSLLWMC